jgi:hypothetical protein
MFLDWAWSDYGLGLITDKPRLRLDRGRGLLAEVEYPRTRFGRG